MVRDIKTMKNWDRTQIIMMVMIQKDFFICVYLNNHKKLPISRQVSVPYYPTTKSSLHKLSASFNLPSFKHAVSFTNLG